MPPSKGQVTARAVLCLLTLPFQAPCRALHRPVLQNPHQTQPKSFALIISTQFGQASQSRFCLQVFKVKGALRFTGCLRAAPMETSKTDRISWGREGRALAAAGGQREADFVLPGWGARAPFESLPHTVIYCIPPGACRPLGVSHLLPAHSPALAHCSPPRQRTPQSHVLPPAKSHAVERRLRARKLGQFQLSAPAEELPNVSACKSSAQIKAPGEAGDWLCQPVLQQTWCSLSAGSCLNKLLERMKLSFLQACITLHSGVG